MDEIRNISLIDIFKKYGNRHTSDFVKDGKNRYLTQCHMHNDKDPSLNIYDKTEQGQGWDYHCFVCKAHGDALQLLVDLGVANNTGEAEAILMKDFGLELPDIVDLETFCKLKGIDIEFAKQNGWADVDFNEYGEHGKGLMITFYNENRTVIGRKIRTKYTGKGKYHYISHPDYPNDQPYGLHWLKDYDTNLPIYITEGETDAMTLRQAGLQSLGIPSTNGWKQEFTELIAPFNRIIVVKDNDKAGENLVNSITDSIDGKIFILQAIKGIKDINDFHIYKCNKNIDKFKENFKTLLEIPASPQTFIAESKVNPAILEDKIYWTFMAKALDNDVKIERFVATLAEETKLGKRAIASMLKDAKTITVSYPDWYIVTKSGVILKPNDYAKHLARTFNFCRIIGQDNKFIGDWFLYKDGRYQPVPDEFILNLITENLIEECKNDPKNIRDTFFFLKTDTSIIRRELEFDSNPYIMNVKNGLLNIATMELTPHTPNYLSLLQLNTEYSPDNADYTYLNKFLDDKIPDKDVRALAQEVLGYSISSFNCVEKWFMLKGEGRSGKGTFLNIIEHVLGNSMVSNVRLQDFNNRFATSALFGKLANIQADLPFEPIKDKAVAVLKSLVGRDGVDAEFKGKDKFKFVNKAKILFGCNKFPPNIGDNQENSFWSKLVIIPMPHSDTVNVDVNFKYKLVQDSSLNAVFIWAIEGLKRLIANDFTFTHSKLSEEFKREYKEVSSNTIRFALDYAEWGSPETHYTPSAVYMGLYELWSSKVEGTHSKSIPNVISELSDFFLSEYGVTITKAKVTRPEGRKHYILGLRLNVKALINDLEPVFGTTNQFLNNLKTEYASEF